MGNSIKCISCASLKLATQLLEKSMPYHREFLKRDPMNYSRWNLCYIAINGASHYAVLSSVTKGMRCVLWTWRDGQILNKKLREKSRFKEVILAITLAADISYITETSVFNKNHDSTKTGTIFQGACFYQQFSLPRWSVKHVFIILIIGWPCIVVYLSWFPTWCTKFLFIYI
jgi:hypothetical protein